MPIETKSTLPATPNTGQVTINGATQVQMKTTVIDLVAGEISIKAGTANANAVYLGGSAVTTSDGFELRPGQLITISLSTPSNLYVVGTGTTDVLSWIAT